MANFYKSVLFDPTDTNLNTLYTAPSNARAIIQNIQIQKTYKILCFY